MNKKFLKLLVQASYTNKHLDAEKVEKIAKYLTRKELKEYIKRLKAREKELTVIVTVPSRNNVTTYLNTFKSLFPDKKIDVQEDPSLMLGIRVTENDMVFDMSLRNSLNQIMSYIENNL